MPCAAASSSMARMCAVLAIIGCRRRAANVAIETWSSWFARGRQAVDAGRMRQRLVLAASAAAVTCAIMKPEFSPRRPPGTAAGATRRRRSASRCGARRSRRSRRSRRASSSAASATGSAWKLPPETIAPSLGEDQRVVGHRVGLAQQHQRGVAQLVEAGAHHLRLAAQAVRILHAVVASRCERRIALPASSAR